MYVCALFLIWCPDVSNACLKNSFPSVVPVNFIRIQKLQVHLSVYLMCKFCKNIQITLGWDGVLSSIGQIAKGKIPSGRPFEGKMNRIIVIVERKPENLAQLHRPSFEPAPRYSFCGQ